YLDGVALTGDTLPCITPSLPGNYTVVVTNALGCVSQPSTPLQVIGTGFSGSPENRPHVAPNPTTGLFTLTFPTVLSQHFLLCDAQGRVLEQFRSTGVRVDVDLGDHPAGLYLLRGVERPWAVRVVKE
ncbi:MAG: T9SS type A sorting domain-containing protein, partial [Flavobacteriales bacterium]|nr:T9SS type A sorting domain-containing protein [Flavobacteriales bacterium]